MNLQVEWSPPLPMRRMRSLTYKLDLGRIPEDPGVYVFGRRWGDSFEALYVGKAKNVRTRVNGQLNNLKLRRFRVLRG
jgi:excinuclease UvrABC nuclease subunit